MPKVLAVFASPPISPVDVWAILIALYDSHHHQYSDADSLGQGHHMNAVQTPSSGVLGFRPFPHSGAESPVISACFHSERRTDSHASEGRSSSRCWDLVLAPIIQLPNLPVRSGLESSRGSAREFSDQVDDRAVAVSCLFPRFQVTGDADQDSNGIQRRFR